MKRALIAPLLIAAFASPALAGKIIIKNESGAGYLIDIRCASTTKSVASLRETSKNVFRGTVESHGEGSCEQTVPENKTAPIADTNESKAMTLKVFNANTVSLQYEGGPEQVLEAKIAMNGNGEVQKLQIKDAELVRKTRSELVRIGGDNIRQIEENPAAKTLIFYINDLNCRRQNGRLICETVGGLEFRIAR